MTDTLAGLMPKTVGGRNIVADECSRIADHLRRISDTLLCAGELYKDELINTEAPVHLLQKAMEALSVVLMEAHASWSGR